ncbi:MAG: NAD-dependent epimerase/dehydratase family protein [Ferruginibacter sp.]
MKILITGASGYLGNKLANKLADLGNEVHALVRPSSSEEFLRHPNITVFKGDILNKESLMAAMNGCIQVYHTAAKVGVWAKDPSDFYDVNVEGTRHVLDAALESGVEKTVFTSSSGVIGPTLNKPLEENDPRLIDFVIDYDLSKKKAEDVVVNYVKEGMNVVIVSPSKVYGPGNVSHSLTANAIINTFLKKRITFIPSPGNFSVCFAFADDVVNGHILAMERGRSGEKYILGGINISYYDFFHRIRTLAHCNAYIIKLSKGTIKTWAGLQKLTYKVLGVPIRFTVKSVDHVFCNYTFSSRKAIQDLNYCITPLDEALQKTIIFLKNNNYD